MQVIVGQTLPVSMFIVLNQYFNSTPKKFFAEAPSILLVESKETFAARFLDLILDLALHARRRGSLPGRETEDVRFGELQFSSELISLLKIAVAFTGEAGYDVGADVNTWDQLASSGYNRLVARAVIAA